MEKKKVGIVIPVYKETLTSDEALSLKQCCRVLGDHPIMIVTYEGLNLSEYNRISKPYSLSLTPVCFDKEYFAGISGYNELLLTKTFYQAFANYEYILIYQLDAFIFRDELLYWCNKGYDYLGAPWFKKIWRLGYTKKLRAVGNGGFSLRRVDACLRVLNHTGRFKKRKYLFTFGNSVFLKLRKLPRKRWKSLIIDSTVHFYTTINKKTEDQFWAIDTQHSEVPFSVAPLKEAIPFAFEVNPSLLYEMNNQELPFGCHAWERYEPDFWKPFIEKETDQMF